MLTRRQFLATCARTAAACAVPGLWSPAPAAAAGTVPIPVYHRVGPGADYLTIPASRLTADLQYLAANGYLTLTLGRLKEYILSGRQLPAKAVFITFDDGYLDNYEHVFPLLKAYDMTATFFVISGLVGQPGRLTASQIMEMSAAGMYFGSHTVSHRSLAAIAPWENSLELVKSKADLEDLLGHAVDFLAYPYGSYSAVTLQIAREAGYWGGLTVIRGRADLAANQLTLRRFPIFRSGQRLSQCLF